MKAIILAAGKGTRINQLSEKTNKCLLKIKGKSIIEYNLDSISNLNISEIIIVVGYKKDRIIKKYGSKYNKIKIRYVEQNKQKGLVNAIAECQSWVDDNFFLLLGDEFFYKPDHKGMLFKFKELKIFGLCGVVEEKNIRKISQTYTICYDNDMKIIKAVEKPKIPFNNYMGTGSCIFNKDLFNYIESTPVNPKRKQKELPSLIQCAINDGHIIQPYTIANRYFNINSKNDLDDVIDFSESM